MAFLTVSDVSMVFPIKGNGRFLALDSISMDVTQSEFVCLIGHSGCGKSTLLNLIAGLILPSAGRILCEDKAIRGPGPDRALGRGRSKRRSLGGRRDQRYCCRRVVRRPARP